MFGDIVKTTECLKFHFIDFSIFRSTLDEIARQLIASDAQVVFATPEIYTTVQQAVVNAKRDIKIVCIKTSNDEVIPTGSIDFAELIDTKSKLTSQLPASQYKPKPNLFHFLLLFIFCIVLLLFI